MSRTSIVNDMAKFAARALGKSLPMFQSGFKDPKTDEATRVSFKYGCSRGVTGTPYFFVNGFALPGSGSALDYETWRSIIDPLLESLQGRSEQALFEF
ncbi:uncharacterized protein M6B38_145380 [Iris pallida]|nr:uncharacterized protein M6B38_145380 [Iris pallida]